MPRYVPPGLQGPMVARRRRPMAPPGMQGPLTASSVPLQRPPGMPEGLPTAQDARVADFVRAHYAEKNQGPMFRRLMANGWKPPEPAAAPGGAAAAAPPVDPRLQAFDTRAKAQQDQLRASWEDLAARLQTDKQTSTDQLAALARAAGAAYASNSPTGAGQPGAVAALPGQLSELARQQQYMDAVGQSGRMDSLITAARAAGVTGLSQAATRFGADRLSLEDAIAKENAKAQADAADRSFQERKFMEDARHNKASENNTSYSNTLNAIFQARGLDAKTAQAAAQQMLNQQRYETDTQYKAGQLEVSRARAAQAGQPPSPKTFSSAELVAKGFRGGWAGHRPGSVQASDTGRWYAPPPGKTRKGATVKVDAKGFTTSLPRLLTNTTQDPATGKKLTTPVAGAWRTAIAQGVQNYKLSPGAVLNQVLNATTDEVGILDAYDALRQAGVSTQAARAAVRLVPAWGAEDYAHLDAITTRNGR